MSSGAPSGSTHKVCHIYALVPLSELFKAWSSTKWSCTPFKVDQFEHVVLFPWAGEPPPPSSSVNSPWCQLTLLIFFEHNNSLFSHNYGVVPTFFVSSPRHLIYEFFTMVGKYLLSALVDTCDNFSGTYVYF